MESIAATKIQKAYRHKMRRDRPNQLPSTEFGKTLGTKAVKPNNATFSHEVTPPSLESLDLNKKSSRPIDYAKLAHLYEFFGLVYPGDDLVNIHPDPDDLDLFECEIPMEVKMQQKKIHDDCSIDERYYL